MFNQLEISLYPPVTLQSLTILQMPTHHHISLTAPLESIVIRFEARNTWKQQTTTSLFSEIHSTDKWHLQFCLAREASDFNSQLVHHWNSQCRPNDMCTWYPHDNSVIHARTVHTEVSSVWSDCTKPCTPRQSIMCQLTDTYSASTVLSYKLIFDRNP